MKFMRQAVKKENIQQEEVKEQKKKDASQWSLINVDAFKNKKSALGATSKFQLVGYTDVKSFFDEDDEEENNEDNNHNHNNNNDNNDSNDDDDEEGSGDDNEPTGLVGRRVFGTIKKEKTTTEGISSDDANETNRITETKLGKESKKKGKTVKNQETSSNAEFGNGKTTEQQTTASADSNKFLTNILDSTQPSSQQLQQEPSNKKGKGKNNQNKDIRNGEKQLIIPSVEDFLNKGSGEGDGDDEVEVVGKSRPGKRSMPQKDKKQKKRKHNKGN